MLDKDQKRDVSCDNGKKMYRVYGLIVLVVVGAWTADTVAELLFFSRNRSFADVLIGNISRRGLWARAVYIVLTVVLGYWVVLSVKKTNELRRYQQHMNKVLRALLNVNKLITRTIKRKELLERTCSLLTGTRGYFHCWIAQYGRNGEVTKTYESNLGRQFSGMDAYLREGNRPGCITRAEKSDDIVVIDDERYSCNNCPLREMDNQCGTAAMCRLLRHEGVAYAFLCVSVPVDYARDTQEQELFGEITRDIAYALYSIDQKEEKTRAEKRFEQAIQEAPYPAMIHTQEGKVLFINEAWTHASGYAIDEIPTVDAWVQQACLDEIRCHSVKKSTKDNPEPFHIGEISIATKSGTQHVWDFHCTPLEPMESGNSPVLCIAADITEQTRQREHLETTRHRLQNAMRTGAIAWWEMNVKTGVVECDAMKARMLGYDPHVFQNTTSHKWLGLLHPDDYTRVVERMSAHIKGEEPDYVVDYRIKAKNGTYRWLHDRGKCTEWDEQGNSRMITGVVMDITERKHVEHALLQRERNERITLDSIGDAVISTDKHGIIRRMNPVAERLTGWKREEATGKKLTEVFRIVDSSLGTAMTDPVEFVLRSGKVATLSNHTVLISREGTRYQISDSAAPIRDEEGGIVGTVLVFRDVTWEYRQKQKLKESEQRFRNLSDMLPQTVFEADTDGNLLFVNKNGLHTFGFTAEDFERGINVFKALAEQDRERATKRLDEMMRTNLSAEEGVEYTAVTKDGRMFPVLIYSNLMRDTIGGKPIGIRGTVVDISGLKNAWNSYYKSENRLREIFSNAPVGIFRTTIEGHPVELNSEMARILGCESAEEAMESFTELSRDLYVYPQQREEFVNRLKTNGRVNDYEYLARRKNSEKNVWISMNARLVTSSSGQNLIDGFAMDISEKKNVLEEKQKMEERIRQTERMEAIGKLAGGIAHDFNNVLGGMLGYTDMTLDDVEKGSVAEKNLRKVLAAGERAKNLVAQILTYSRKNDSTRKPIFLSSVVRETVEMLRSAIPSSIIINRSFDKETLPVHANAKQIHEVLVNLFTNAADAIETGGIIDISLKELYLGDRNEMGIPSGTYAVMHVSDNGCGMNEEVQKKIFDPFFTLKPPDRGTGMGLAMVRGIITQHEGYIFMESEENVGTAFTIYLPKIPYESGVVDMSHATPRKGESEHILFVDDERMISDMYAAMFKKIGYRVSAFTDPERALEEFLRDPDRYDIMISDQTMPKLTGTELSKEVLAVRPGLPVIICTGFSEFAYKHSASNHGIRAYCIKPMQKNEFSKIVRNILDTQE